MTKLIEIININRKIEKCFSRVINIKKMIELKRKEQSNLRKRNILKYLHEYFNIMDEIERLEQDKENIILEIYNIRNKICKHEILLLLNKSSKEINIYNCPACETKIYKNSIEIIKDYPNSIIIDKSDDIKRNRYINITMFEFLKEVCCFISKNKDENLTISDFISTNYIKDDEQHKTYVKVKNENRNT